jgi:hypothetical protein
MIESVEEDLLLDVCRSLQMDDDDIVCEFGCYLGRSTHAIALGLAERPSAKDRRRALLHAFDLFECDQQGILARYLLSDIERAGVAHLLRRESGRLDFRSVFQHFMADLPAGLVQVHQTPLSLARHPGGRIAMMHVDAPKWYAEYRQLLVEFGPHLKRGALVVFQDFFYHWAAELIAAVERGIELAYFEPLETAASSLLVRVSQPVSAQMLASLDTSLESGGVDQLVRSALKRFARFEVDRPQQFLPRLYLAGLQHAMQSGDFTGASMWLKKLANAFSGALPLSVVADLAELVGNGFSVRTLYELDCGNSIV